DQMIPSGERVSAAGRAQGLALPFGKGRVVVMGEAAELSAQILGRGGPPMGMNAPGIDNRQLALNIMHWLSRLLKERRGSPMTRRALLPARRVLGSVGATAE